LYLSAYGVKNANKLTFLFNLYPNALGNIDTPINHNSSIHILGRINMTKKNLISAAMGNVECDLALTNAQVIDVLGHAIRKANIYIKDGTIVGWVEGQGDGYCLSPKG
jgi:hypothetical protein